MNDREKKIRTLMGITPAKPKPSDEPANNPVLPPENFPFVRPDTDDGSWWASSPEDERSTVWEWIRAILMVVVFFLIMFSLLVSLLSEDVSAQESQPQTPLPATILEMLGADRVEQPTTFTFIRLYGTTPKTLLPTEE